MQKHNDTFSPARGGVISTEALWMKLNIFKFNVICDHVPNL
jgi:hypothetical protein